MLDSPNILIIFFLKDKTMAKKAEVKDVENTAVEVQATETKPKEPDFNTVKLSEISVVELVSYKKIADLMFEYYDNEAKSFLGDYDEATKARYTESYERQNYFRMIREAVRAEMEERLLKLDQAVLIWKEFFAKD